jgi:hypothetical protein
MLTAGPAAATHIKSAPESLRLSESFGSTSCHAGPQCKDETRATLTLCSLDPHSHHKAVAGCLSLPARCTVGMPSQRVSRWTATPPTTGFRACLIILLQLPVPFTAALFSRFWSFLALRKFFVSWGQRSDLCALTAPSSSVIYSSI